VNFKPVTRLQLAYHTALAWHYNRIAAKAALDLLYSDHKSQASKTLREAGTRSNIHEAECVYLKALIDMDK
jgi:hypothetical protein